MVTLPAGRVTISTPSWLIAMLFSLPQSNALPFNPHSSRSGSVQRILSAVPAERSPLTAEDLAAGTTDRMLFVNAAATRPRCRQNQFQQRAFSGQLRWVILGVN